jgi:hypothetical protein
MALCWRGINLSRHKYSHYNLLKYSSVLQNATLFDVVKYQLMMYFVTWVAYEMNFSIANGLNDSVSGFTVTVGMAR